MLFASFGNLNNGVLVVGRRFSWMINARTSDRRYYIGTRLYYGYDAKLCNHYTWQRLEEQVMRYSAPGARITVYTLPF